MVFEWPEKGGWLVSPPHPPSQRDASMVAAQVAWVLVGVAGSQLVYAHEGDTRRACACAATTSVDGAFSHTGCSRGIDMTKLGFEDRDWCDTLDPMCIGSMGVAGSDYCTADQADMGVNCAALASDTLNLPACSSIAAPSGCSIACAELWLGAAARCSGKYSSMFEAVAPATHAACATTAMATLATSPHTVTVSGASCYSSANALFVLQTAPMNRRPLYATADKSWYMYWVPNLEGTAVWLIDPNLQTPAQWSSGLGSARISLTSAAETPPAGSAVWREACSTANEVRLMHTRLYLDPGVADEIAPASLTVLEETVAIGMNGAHDFAFLAEAGTRYQLDVRVEELTLTTPCSSNALDNPASGGGEGTCDDAISSGQVTCEEDLCAECGANAHLCDKACGFLCGESAPCTTNSYEEGAIDGTVHGDGACDDLIPSVAGEPDISCPGPVMGAYDPAEYGGHQPTFCEVTCAANFCAACPLARYCDKTCAFLCPEGGITSTTLYVLPPGAAQLSQAVAAESGTSPDKGIAFTAAATGSFTARVVGSEGSGPVTLSIIAVGTAVERSPLLRTDSTPHQFSVSCQFTDCAFSYDGVSAFDSDSQGFDLVLPDAQAGRAYAVTIELPPGQTAAQASATFYQAKAAAGAAGFIPVVEGPLGAWTETPSPAPCVSNAYDEQEFTGMCDLAIASGQLSCASDFCAECGVCPHQTTCTDYSNLCDRSCGVICEHQSLAEFVGCSNELVHQCSALRSLPASFGVHPGGRFGSYLVGTWVAPAAGPILMRLNVNCDSVVYADVQAGGCTIGERHNTGARTSSCGPASDGTYKNKCFSELLLTATPGAYIAQPGPSDGRRRVQKGGDHLHNTVDTHAPSPILGIVQRTDIITVQRADIEAQVADRWQATPADQRTLPASPTIDQMLVSGTPANTMLQSLFTVEQQPHVIYPLVLDESDVASVGHRRTQNSGDDLQVTVETHAPAPGAADRAEQRLVGRLPPGVVVEHAGTCDLPSRTEAVNSECCDEPTEDCSSGQPVACNVGCAAVVLPFFRDCSNILGKHASDFDSVVALCHVALGKGRRRAQMGGDHLHHTIDTHAVCGLGATDDDGCTAAGQTVRQTRLLLGRDAAEALARGAFVATPAPERTMASAPTLDEMLVGGTPANAMLSSFFVQEQQPALVRPTAFDSEVAECGRRRLQKSGDELHVTIDTHAATPDEANRAVHRLASSINGVMCLPAEG